MAAESQAVLDRECSQLDVGDVVGRQPRRSDEFAGDRCMARSSLDHARVFVVGERKRNFPGAINRDHVLPHDPS